MKTFKYILLLISVSLLYACSKDENDLYKEERSSLLSSTQIGIYQNGKALLLFDKQAHQYYCNPSQKLFRIQDAQGKQYTALQLNALPSGQERTDGKVEGNMGIKLDGIHSYIFSNQTNSLYGYGRMIYASDSFYPTLAFQVYRNCTFEIPIYCYHSRYLKKIYRLLAIADRAQIQ